VSTGPCLHLDAMTSAEREPMMASSGGAPSGVPRTELPVGSVGKGPLKLNACCILHVQRKSQICPITDIWQSHYCASILLLDGSILCCLVSC